jgi:hypothetical protein
LTDPACGFSERCLIRAGFGDALLRCKQRMADPTAPQGRTTEGRTSRLAAGSGANIGWGI